jgi:hypothetical protein
MICKSYRLSAHARHPDSIVSETIAYDLLMRVNDIAEGRIHDERLLGPKIECP